MKGWDEVGGRSDVTLAEEIPDIGPWRISELPLLEADEIGGERDFPTVGTFAAAELLGDRAGEERYIQITEGLRDMVDELRNGEGVTDVAIEIDSAEKAGGEETAPWRYTGTVKPLGPPQD